MACPAPVALHSRIHERLLRLVIPPILISAAIAMFANSNRFHEH